MVLLAVILSIAGFLGFVGVCVYLVRLANRVKPDLEIPPDGVYRITRKSIDPITGQAEYEFTVVEEKGDGK
jgi:hypothetical protein